MTPQERAQTRDRTRIRNAETRAQENEEQRDQRNLNMRETIRTIRNRLTDANRGLNQLADRLRHQTTTVLTLASFNRMAFDYDPQIEYSAHPKVTIGDMTKECEHCHALKFKNETAGMCCASGKVVLPALNPPPEPLKSLMSGESSDSKLFLRKIKKFNSCFQMTSFAANIILNTDRQGRNFESTFTIRGQVYHRLGSLLPMPNQPPRFLQIYFMGNEEDQVNLRCENSHIVQIQERSIVSSLETFLAENNQLIQLFKQVSGSFAN